MRAQRRSLMVLAATAILLGACGGGQTQADPEADEAIATEPPPASQTGQDAAEDATPGTVAFTADGEEMSFDYLPESEVRYHHLGSSIWAYPEAGSTESFAIHFMSIDLKTLTYPTDLPLPKDPSQPFDPMAAMASVGFGYINAEGVEWAGPGKIQIESFGADGVMRGSFDQVSLPHTDNELPNITVTGGNFHVRITSP